MTARSKNFVISNEGAKTFHLPDFGLEHEKLLEVSCALIVSYIKNFNNNNNIFNCKWSVSRWQWFKCMNLNMK